MGRKGRDERSDRQTVHRTDGDKNEPPARAYNIREGLTPSVRRHILK